MSKFDKDLKVGDFITAYVAGYHKVIEIKRRFYTKEEIDRYKIYSDKTPGEEYSSLIKYIRVLDSTFQERASKPCSCDAIYCNKLTKKQLQETKEEEIKTMSEGYDKLISMVEE